MRCGLEERIQFSNRCIRTRVSHTKSHNTLLLLSDFELFIRHTLKGCNACTIQEDTIQRRFKPVLYTLCTIPNQSQLVSAPSYRTGGEQERRRVHWPPPPTKGSWPLLLSCSPPPPSPSPPPPFTFPSPTPYHSLPSYDTPTPSVQPTHRLPHPHTPLILALLSLRHLLPPPQLPTTSPPPPSPLPLPLPPPPLLLLLSSHPPSSPPPPSQQPPPHSAARSVSFTIHSFFPNEIKKE